MITSRKSSPNKPNAIAMHMTSPARSANTIPSAEDALSVVSALIAPLPTVSTDQKETSLEVFAP